MKTIQTISGISFDGVVGKSILDSAIASGIFFPHSCKTGRCKTCKCKVVDGDTQLLSEESGLTDAEKADNWILSCVRGPISELIINAEGISKFAMPQITMQPCRINSLEMLSSDVIGVNLRLPPNSRFEYLTGQYIDVIKGDLIRSYSIANAPRRDGQVELHIKRVNGGEMSAYWFEQAKVNDLLRLNGPLGTFFLRNFAGKKLVFLATGAGFAPVKAILESFAQMKPEDRPGAVKVYWGGRILSDLYYAAPDIGFPYVFRRVLSRSSDGDVRGYVQDACLAESIDFQNTQVFACGSNAMIEDARRLLVDAGLVETEFYSDAFVCSGSLSK